MQKLKKKKKKKKLSLMKTKILEKKLLSQEQKTD